MTSYRAPLPYHERKHSWEEPDLMPQRRDEDYLYGYSLTGYGVDSGCLLYDQDEDHLDNGRRDYIEYRTDNPDLREREGRYRHLEREDRKPPLLWDFRKNEESARDLYPDLPRDSRFYDNLDEYIREQRELMNADSTPRGKKPSLRSLLELEPLNYEDDRSRDYDRDGDYRSRGYMPEERSRDYGHRSCHDDSDNVYRCGDYNDDYCRNERRSRMEELDYRDSVAPRRHDYHRQPARNGPYYQRDFRNDHEKRDEDILYDYRDRHRRCTDREFRKRMNEYNSHERANSPERDCDRRGREYSCRNKYPISSCVVQDERPTRSGVRGYDNEPQRGTERVEPRCKRERRSSREEYAQYPSPQIRRARGGRHSGSPCATSKAYSRSSSPARFTSSGRVPTQEKYPKRKMSMYEVNGTKRRKHDGRQTNASPKKQETPNTELITRDQFLSRDVFNSRKDSRRVPEDKSTKTKDLGFRDCTSSRHSCGERDLRHELSESRAATSGTKSTHLGDSSDFEERSSTASSTRIIDNVSSVIRSIKQVPKKKFQDPSESRTKIKEEVEIYPESAQTKSSLIPGPVIKPLAKQVSTPSSADPHPVNTATGQPVRSSEVPKRKVSICPTRAPSPLLCAVEKPKVELPADDLRLLIMSRRLRQNEETSPSLDNNLSHKNEEPTMLPQTKCQVSNQSQGINITGSADGMVELSYSDPEGSANEDSAPPTPKGHAGRTVVMRRQVILDYGQERSHPRTSHQSPVKEKEKDVDKEKESSRTPNAVVEVVSEGAANLPVLTYHPLYKEEDSKILSTVEVVDNSFEPLDSHAADESQTSRESNRDVNSYEAEHTFSATADDANSSVVYKQKYGYLQQIEDVSNQGISDYNGPASVDKYQETEENVVDAREGEHFEEESHGAWTTSSGHYGIEQQTYQELGHFEEESDAVKQNTSVPHEDEQQSISHYDQEFSQIIGDCRGENDAVIKNPPDYKGEKQHFPHCEQEYSPELGYNAEMGDDVKEDPSGYYEEVFPQYEQKYSQEHGYGAEEGDTLRENSPENNKDHPRSYYDQEYSQDLGHYTQSDVVREDASNHQEDHPRSYYDQEYSQDLGHYTQSDVVREDASNHQEDHPRSYYDQEYSQDLGHHTQSDVVREDASNHQEDHPRSYYDQEYSQDLGHHTQSDVVREDASNHQEDHPRSYYNQEYSQDLGHYTQSDVVREDASNLPEDHPHFYYEQEYSQDLHHHRKKSDSAREDRAERDEEDFSCQEQEYDENDRARENPPENHREDQPISHYEQELYQELGGFPQEGDAVREGYSEHYEDLSTPQYDLPTYLEHDHVQDESDALRKNSLEEKPERQSVSHHKQKHSQKLGSYNDNDDVEENTSESYGEQQPVSHYEQGISQEIGDKDGPDEMGQNSPESYEEDKPVLQYENEAENSDSADEDKESSMETFQEENDDNEQESFSELEVFAGMRDSVPEGFSELSEQDALFCDYDEESSETGDDDKSLSSGEESYQSTTDEVKYCKIEESDKRYENDVSERRYTSYGNAEASFSGYKASDGSEYPLLTRSGNEYDDDSEEETLEISNGFDVILALDSVSYDENPTVDKIVPTIDYEHSASECEGIERSDEDPDAGKEDVNESDGTSAEDDEVAIIYDSSYECDKRGIPEEGPNTGIEDSHQTDENPVKYENEKSQGSDGCEIQRLGLNISPCNNGETEGRKSRPTDLNWSSVSKYVPDLPAKDYNCVNKQNSYRHDGHVLQEANHSPELLNRSSGSEYNPALPTKDYGTLTRQNRYADGVDDLQSLKHSADVLNMSSASSEYDPSLPTKDHGNIVMGTKYDGYKVMRKSNHTTDILDTSTSSGLECDPAIPTKDNISSQVNRVDIDSQELRHLADRSKSSSSEDNPQIPTKDWDVIMEEDGHNDDAFQELPHPDQDLDNRSGSKTAVCKPAESYGVTHEQDYRSDDVIEELRHPDLDKVSDSEMDLHIPANDFAVTNKQENHCQNITQEACHPVYSGKSNGSGNVHRLMNEVRNEQDCQRDDVTNNSLSPFNKNGGSEHVRFSTNDCDVTYEQNYGSDDVIQNLRSSGVNKNIVTITHNLGTITENVGAQQSLAESNAMPAVHKTPDAQENVIVTCHSEDTTSVHSGSSYEVVLEEECRVLGATAEIFLPSDIDAHHICIYECVDFHLLCVHHPTSITSDQGSKQLFHNLQTDINVRQEDLPTCQITPASNQGSSNSTVVAPLLCEECVIEEKRVVQNQVDLICSPMNDKDQISSQVEKSRSRLNVVEATSQNAVEWESVDHRNQVETEHPAIILPQNNTAISHKSYSSTGDERKEIDDPDLMYLDEVQYFEGEQPIGKSENTEKTKNSNQDFSAEDVSGDNERCDSSNDSVGEMSLYSTETNFSEMISKLRQEFVRCTQNDGYKGTDCLFSETKYSHLSDAVIQDQPYDPECASLSQLSFSDMSSDAVLQDQPYDPECTSLNQVSFSDMSSDDVLQDQPYDPECTSLNQVSFSDMSSDAVLQDQPYDPECTSLNQVSFSDMSSDDVLQDQPYDPECTSLNQVSFSDLSSDDVLQDQPYDPECASLNQVSFSDMSLETPSTSSQVSPKCSQVPAFESLKTQRAVSTIRTYSNQPSLCDVSLESHSSSVRVSNMHEDSDLKSRKPYDPANCLMDVDTFSELSGMSLDTPSSSAVEYVATEADTTLVGVADDDSEPYTPEAYSQSPENDSEPYTPEAYSPVLLLSGDESDPELFSCRYMDDASAPYNPASHWPADMSMSGASGNEADNEVSTGISSPEFSTNERKHLSLKLKKPSAQKVRWSCVGNSSLDKESSNDDTWQKNTEVYSPESFQELSKAAAVEKCSNRKSARLHSRSNSDDVERSVENEKPCASRKSLPSSRKKSERSGGKGRNSKKEHTTMWSKRKPLKSLTTMFVTNKRAKEDEVKKNVDHHAGSKTKKESGTKCHDSKAIPKKKERSTPPLKKPKLSSRSPIERSKRRSPVSPGTNTAQQHKKRPSERRNSRDEKFKKPVSPGKYERNRRSSERTKDSGQKKTTRKSSEVERKGCSEAGSSFTLLDELKTIMKNMHQKSPKSSKGTKSPDSSTVTKNTPNKAKETFNELHLLDEGHELLELALEESINRSRADKSPCMKRSSNLAKKVDKMKRKLAETEEMSRNEKMNLTRSFKPSEQETRVQLAYVLDNNDSKGSGKAVEALSEASLYALKATNQNSPIRLIDDNFKSMKLAVKCSGGENDAIDSGVVTRSKKTDKDSGREKTLGVAFQEKKSDRKNVHDHDCGRVTRDNGVSAYKNVVSSAIENFKDSTAEIHSATVTNLRPTRFQETVGEPVEVNIVSSEDEKRMNKRNGQASDKENRLATSANPGSARSEETGKILITDKLSSLIKNNANNTVGEPDHRRGTSDLNVAKKLDRENEINSRKDDHEEVSVKDSCKVSEEVTNTLSAYSVISLPTSKYLSQGKSSRKVCGQNSEMPGRQLQEDKTGKTVITDNEVKEVQIDLLSKTQDASKRRRGNEKHVLVQDKDDWSTEGLPNMEKQDGEKNEFDQKNNDWSTEGLPNMEKQDAEKNKFDQKNNDWSTEGLPNMEKQDAEKNVFDQKNNDWSTEGLPNMEKQDAEKNVFDQKGNDWSTESISEMTDASCTGSSRNAEKLNMAVIGVKTRNIGKKNEKTDGQNADISPNSDEQGVTCLPTLQRSKTNKENQFVINAFCATIESELLNPYRDKDTVEGCSSNQGVAESLATPCWKASTPHVQTKADVSSTLSGVSCTQTVQVAGDAAIHGKGSTPEAQPESDGPPPPIGVEVEDPRVAIPSTSVGPSAPKKNLNGKQAGRDGGAQDSESVIFSGQSIEEGKEISLEEYIEAQLHHGLSLPDISVSKVSSEAIPSLPPISFPSSAATPNVSNNSALSPLKLPLPSSAIKFHKTDLSPVPSEVENDTCFLSETSKESPPALSAREESPSMDIVRSLTAEYEKRIIVILQKRVDVEKAYREECAKIVNAVKALARKKKNMERELRDILQTSLREISQKYISELQRFVRNETI